VVTMPENMPGTTMCRRTLLRGLTIVAGAALFAIVVGVVPARAILLDDLNRPGEGWSPPPMMAPGSSSYGVMQLQERLAELGFRPGYADGVYDDTVTAAVIAFQKAYGLERDGQFKAADWNLLDQPMTVGASDVPSRVEVDLRRQILYLVVDGSVATVVPISTGSGGTYRGMAGVSRARTPEGAFLFYRHVAGWRISYLGGLYEPYYFDGGYAIHGSLSVPAYPASHGCVRVRIPDMDYLKTQMQVGMPVFVYGANLTRDQVVPGALGGRDLVSSTGGSRSNA
jgi:N-acetylmuramoyl-L-alanine amidase